MKTSVNRSGVVRWALPSMLAIAGFGVASHLSGAAPGLVSPQPTTVGTVDVVRLMSGLTKLGVLNYQLGQRIDERQKPLTLMKEQLDQLTAEMEALPKTAEKEKREKFVQAYELEKTASARKQAMEQLIAIERGDINREVYMDIQAAIAAYAQKNGYDLVMMDDRGMTLPDRAVDRDMNMVIQNKRILYMTETLDITDALIREMNNQFQAPPGYVPPANQNPGAAPAQPPK